MFLSVIRKQDHVTFYYESKNLQIYLCVEYRRKDGWVPINYRNEWSDFELKGTLENEEWKVMNSYAMQEILYITKKVIVKMPTEALTGMKHMICELEKLRMF